MNITDVRIRRIEEEGRLKAVVSVTFDEEFVVHDMKIIDGDNGLFVAMPSRKSSDGVYRDIAHPINGDMRSILMDAILEKYDQELASAPPDDELAE